ncbi:MAG: ClpXP adapter SpxH family protein [Flavobacteriales bacterium]
MRKTILYTALLLLTACSSRAQNHQKMNGNKQTNVNPLLCDPEKGACEMPGMTGATGELSPVSGPRPIHIVYFTDPICSSCWGIEPQLRKLKLEYGAYFDIEYRMGGLLPSWDIYNSGGISKPSDVAHHWDEVSAYYEMPIDGDVWLEDPLSSSYPPSIAFKAAQLQDPNKALLFMRRIREMVFLEKKNITRWEHLAQAAAESGLDSVKLKQDYQGQAEALFRDDLSLARSMGVRGFPTMFFSDSLGNRLMMYGVKPYEAFVQTLRKLLPEAQKKETDTGWEHLFAHYPTLTNKEFAVLSGRTYGEAEQLLKGLYDQKKLQHTQCKNGVLWKRPGQ